MKMCSYPGCDCETYQGDECIFHCEKTERNGWISTDDDVNIKVHLFWDKFCKITKSQKDENFLFTHGFVIPRYRNGDTKGLENIGKIIFRECKFVDKFDFVAKATTQFSIVNSKIENFFRVEGIKVDLDDAYVSILDSEINNSVQLVCNSHVTIDNCNLGECGKFHIWNSPKDGYIAIARINSFKKNDKTKRDGAILIQESYLEKVKVDNVNVDKLSFSELHFPEDGMLTLDSCNSNVLRFENISNLSKNIKFKNSVVYEGLYFNNVDLSDIMFNNFDISECHCFFNKINIVNAKLNSVFWDKHFDAADISMWQRIKRELKPEVDFRDKFDLKKWLCYAKVLLVNDDCHNLTYY